MSESLPNGPNVVTTYSEIALFSFSADWQPQPTLWVRVYDGARRDVLDRKIAEVLNHLKAPIGTVVHVSADAPPWRPDPKPPEVPADPVRLARDKVALAIKGCHEDRELPSLARALLDLEHFLAKRHAESPTSAA